VTHASAVATEAARAAPRPARAPPATGHRGVAEAARAAPDGGLAVRGGGERDPTAPPSLRLCEQAADHALGLRVGPHADVHVPDDAAPIDDDGRGPGPDAEPAPGREVVVQDDRVSDPELPDGGGDAVRAPLPGKLRRVDAHDRQPGAPVPLVPVPQLRDHVAAVDSAEGPELHQHDPPPEIARRERWAVEPRTAGDRGRGLPDPGSARGRDRQEAEREPDQPRQDAAPGPRGPGRGAGGDTARPAPLRAAAAAGARRARAAHAQTSHGGSIATGTSIRVGPGWASALSRARARSSGSAARNASSPKARASAGRSGPASACSP